MRETWDNRERGSLSSTSTPPKAVLKQKVSQACLQRAMVGHDDHRNTSLTYNKTLRL